MIYTPPMLQSDWSECYNHGTRIDVHVFCLLHEYIGVPEQALGWLPLGLGLVVEDKYV